MSALGTSIGAGVVVRWVVGGRRAGRRMYFHVRKRCLCKGDMMGFVGRCVVGQCERILPHKAMGRALVVSGSRSGRLVRGMVRFEAASAGRLVNGSASR
jgi:hypothetical protein